MSSQQPSQYPPSMGPGARPIPQSDSPGPVSQRDRDRRTRLQEVIAIRESYSVDPSPSSVTISYMLNNRQRSFTLEYASLPLSDFSSKVVFGGHATATTTGTFIIDTIRGVENVTGTQLTQQQAEGFAKHAIKRMQWSYMGIGSAVGVGAFLWHRGRPNMKFPFIKVRDPSKYDNFPNRFLPILKGQYARVMWQITRFNVYTMLAIMGLSPIFGSIGDTSMTVGLYRDDRTRAVLEKMKSSADGLKRIGGNLAGAAGTPTDQPGPDDYGSQEAYTSNGDGYGGESGIAYSDGMDNTSDFSSSTQPSPSQMRPQQPQQQRAQRWGQRAQTPPQPSQVEGPYPGSGQDSGDPFEFNADPLNAALSDPNSPQYDPAAASSQQQKPRQRSWASIRNEARQGSAQSRDQNSQSSSSRDDGYSASPPGPGARSGMAGGRRREQGAGESFSYGAEEADKQYAKEQAQKEFDAMLERERRLGEQGGDGSGGAWGRGRRGG